MSFCPTKPQKNPPPINNNHPTSNLYEASKDILQPTLIVSTIGELSGAGGVMLMNRPRSES